MYFTANVFEVLNIDNIETGSGLLQYRICQGY